jgi:hypothetical protein
MRKSIRIIRTKNEIFNKNKRDFNEWQMIMFWMQVFQTAILLCLLLYLILNKL